MSILIDSGITRFSHQFSVVEMEDGQYGFGDGDEDVAQKVTFVGFEAS